MIADVKGLLRKVAWEDVGGVARGSSEETGGKFIQIRLDRDAGESPLVSPGKPWQGFQLLYQV